jgi:hypothetical protein
MRESGWLSPLELTQLIPWLRLRCWLVSLGIRHVGHSMLHGLQHLCLHDKHLLQCGGGGGLPWLLSLLALRLLVFAI